MNQGKLETKEKLEREIAEIDEEYEIQKLHRSVSVAQKGMHNILDG